MTFENKHGLLARTPLPRIVKLGLTAAVTAVEALCMTEEETELLQIKKSGSVTCGETRDVCCLDMGVRLTANKNTPY